MSVMTNSIMTGTVEVCGPGSEPSNAEGEPPSCAEIASSDSRWQSIGGFEALIPRLAAAALAEAGLDPLTHGVSIALLPGSEVQALNKAFRGKDSPTNVLSFPAAPPPGGASEQVFLGDVALSYETVMEEAIQQDKPALNHAAHLVVHGVLHLAGLDHGSDAGADHMERVERSILGKFGIPDPYADDALNVSSSN
jgi:probable rRNA maturation factor